MRIGDIGTPELILILLVVTLLFGIGRVSKLGGEMGSAIREFRKGLRGDEEDKPITPEPPVTPEDK